MEMGLTEMENEIHLYLVHPGSVINIGVFHFSQPYTHAFYTTNAMPSHPCYLFSSRDCLIHVSCISVSCV